MRAILFISELNISRFIMSISNWTYTCDNNVNSNICNCMQRVERANTKRNDTIACVRRYTHVMSRYCTCTSSSRPIPHHAYPYSSYTAYVSLRGYSVHWDIHCALWGSLAWHGNPEANSSASGLFLEDAFTSPLWLFRSPSWRYIMSVNNMHRYTLGGVRDTKRKRKKESELLTRRYHSVKCDAIIAF